MSLVVMVDKVKITIINSIMRPLCHVNKAALVLISIDLNLVFERQGTAIF